MFRPIPSIIAAALVALALSQACLAESGEEEHEPLAPWHGEHDGLITFRLRGRIDADFIATAQSPANEAIFGDLGDAAGLRRARIGAFGELPGGHYLAEIDLATGDVVIRDLFLGLTGERLALAGWSELRGGHFREPFSLEGATSANTFAFLERSPINTLDPSRAWGLGLIEAASEDYWFMLGVYQNGTDQNDFEYGPGSTIDLTGRLTNAPRAELGDGQMLFYGAALSGRWPTDGVIVISQQPGSPLLEVGDATNSPFVPRIEIPASFQQLANLQLAAANGPVWMQAEWYGTWIDQIGGPPIFFHGCHVDAGWFLTGERRAFDTYGVWGGVRVHRPVLACCACDDRERGWGGWELTARFSYLDFFDADTPLGPAGQQVGVTMPEATFGVNWYLADQMRCMFNYTYALPDEPNTGPSAASTFALRLAWYW